MSARRRAAALGRLSALLPLVNLALAFLVAGSGRAHHRRRSARRRSGSWSTAPSAHPEAIGYTLYYATNFIFTGLAVAVAFHAGLFNIGGEGQAYIGGLGVRPGRCWRFDRYLPAWLLIPVAIIAAAALFGAAWAAMPAWLQASAAATSSSRPSCSTSSPRR